VKTNERGGVRETTPGKLSEMPFRTLAVFRTEAALQSFESVEHGVECGGRHGLWMKADAVLTPQVFMFGCVANNVYSYTR